MILSFDNEKSCDFILDKAQSYFDSEDYVACAKYIRVFIAESSVEDQTFLSTLLARCYHELGSTSMAIISLKRAAAIFDDYPDSLYYLALYQTEMNDKIGVQEAFFALHMVDEDGEMSQEILNLIIADAQQDKEFKLVTTEDIKNNGMQESENCLRRGEFDDALSLLLSLDKRIPNDADILNDIAVIYLCMGETENASIYAIRAIDVDECNPNGYFILSKTHELAEDKEQLMDIADKLMSQEITNLILFRKVASMLELIGDYDKLYKYINMYPSKYAYDAMMMRSIAMLNIGDRAGAIDTIVEVNKIYGDISLAKIYKKYFESEDYTHATVGDYDEMPSGYTDTFENDGFKMVDKITASNCSEIVLKAMSMYNSDKLYKYLKSNRLKIEQVPTSTFMDYINIYSHISNDNKVSVIRYLINFRDVENFTFYNQGSALEASFEEIPCIENYPNIYNEAYKLAFAVACLNARDFEDNLLVSMAELMKAMKDTMYNFRDVKVLATAVLCNSYVIVSDDVLASVAGLMKVSPISVSRCIKTIKKCGAFFDLDQDEIFSKHIQGVMNRFGVMETIE